MLKYTQKLKTKQIVLINFISKRRYFYLVSNANLKSFTYYANAADHPGYFVVVFHDIGFDCGNPGINYLIKLTTT